MALPMSLSVQAPAALDKFLSAMRRLDEGEDDQELVCKVLDTDDDFTSYVQFFLAAFALGSLWIKRLRERPQRNFRWVSNKMQHRHCISHLTSTSEHLLFAVAVAAPSRPCHGRTWFLDVSKMGTGAVYAHVANMGVAMFINSTQRAEGSLDDQCAWYAMNFLIDTTLGLALSVVGLKIVHAMAVNNDWETLQHSGEYEGEGSLRTWSHQTMAWLAILTVVKMILTVFLWVFSPFFAEVGDILFSPMAGSPKFELVFVMILFPGVLNVLYFWAADSFLKKQSPSPDDADAGSFASAGDAAMSVGNMKDGKSGLLSDSHEGDQELGEGGNSGAYEMKGIHPQEPHWLVTQENQRRGETFNL